MHSFKFCRYLDGNNLTKIKHLENCELLEELHLSNNKAPLGSHETLSFEDSSLEALSQSLHTLQIDNSNAVSLAPLSRLSRLRSLHAGM